MCIGALDLGSSLSVWMRDKIICMLSVGVINVRQVRGRESEWVDGKEIELVRSDPISAHIGTHDYQYRNDLLPAAEPMIVVIYIFAFISSMLVSGSSFAMRHFTALSVSLSLCLSPSLFLPHSLDESRGCCCLCSSGRTCCGCSCF